MAHPHPPYDPYYFAPPPTEYRHPPPSEREGISTLFVGGLPDDIKAREIHNLFRRRPGFEFCQLKYTGRGNQVVAFATFLNPQSAMEALISLNGVKFDPEGDSTLFVELARTNSRRSYDPGNGPYVVIDNRGKMNISVHDSSKNDKDSDSDDSEGEENADKDSTVNVDDVAGKEQEDKRADGSCSTLFIANLGPTCTDPELEQVLSQYPGFNSSKVRSRGGMPVAFADFDEVEQATEAMNALQGSTLPSSDRGGMHIEYAKTKMRKQIQLVRSC